MKRCSLTLEDLARIQKYIAEKAPITVPFNMNAQLKNMMKNGYYTNLLLKSTNKESKGKDIPAKYEQCLFGKEYLNIQDG